MKEVWDKLQAIVRNNIKENTMFKNIWKIKIYAKSTKVIIL